MSVPVGLSYGVHDAHNPSTPSMNSLSAKRSRSRNSQTLVHRMWGQDPPRRSHANVAVLSTHFERPRLPFGKFTATRLLDYSPIPPTILGCYLVSDAWYTIPDTEAQHY
jgi:hypothetical protein